MSSKAYYYNRYVMLIRQRPCNIGIGHWDHILLRIIVSIVRWCTALCNKTKKRNCRARLTKTTEPSIKRHALAIYLGVTIGLYQVLKWLSHVWQNAEADSSRLIRIYTPLVRPDSNDLVLQCIDANWTQIALNTSRDHGVRSRLFAFYLKLIESFG